MDMEEGQTVPFDPWRRLELWFWPILVFGIALLTATADYLRDRRDGIDVAVWEPMLRELISATILLFLVWVVVGVHARWHWRSIGKFRYFLLHTILSWPFAFLHVVAAAILISLYPVIFEGAEINWTFIVSRVPAEYPKDVIVYVLILGVTNFYGWARRAVGPQDSVDISERGLTVRTRTGMRFLQLDEIDWIEAASNYVILHASGQEYFLRTTMKEMDERLSGLAFSRVHRSAMINLDKLQEITRSGPRDHKALLTSGDQVRLGRQKAAELLRLRTE